MIVWASSGATETEKLRVTAVAAAVLALPAWVAVMLQVPAATSVNVLPLKPQTVGVVDANDTTKPELAVATSAGAAVPKVWLAGAVKLMVWASSGAAATLNVRLTTLAAANTVLPAWVALMLQPPTATSTNVLPLTVHTAGVVDAKPTTRPDVDVATSAAGALPRVWSGGVAKLMVWASSGAAATAKLRDTGTAAR